MKTNLKSMEELQILLQQEQAARLLAEARLASLEAQQVSEKRMEPPAENEEPVYENSVKGERLFKDVLNNLPGIVFQIYRDSAGVFVYNFVSPVLHQLLGFHVSNTNQILPFVHPNDRNAWTDSLETTYQKGKVWKQEIRFLMPDGTVYWWLSSATPSYAPSGELLYNGILLNTTKQKQAELSLIESEKKWRFALEGSGDGMWEYNALTKEASYSSNFRQMLGYSEAEYRNAPNFWRHAIHPKDLHKVEEMEANYEAGVAESHSIQYRTKNKTGEYVWIMDRGIVLSKDAQGKPIRYIGLHTNINQIKQTEMELATTATKLTTLVTNMQDGIMLEDETNKVVLCNQAFCNIFEIKAAPNLLVGADLGDALLRNKNSFKNIDTYLDRRKELLNDCKIAANEEIELANGKFLSRDYAPLIIDNECKGHLWKYSDITTRKKAEKELVEAERRYRGLIENMQVGLAEFTLDQHILYANHTFYDMCGYGPEELDGHISDLLMVNNRKLAEQKKGLRVKGVSDAYEVEIVTKKGEKRWWYVSGAPRQNEFSQTISTIGACLDITDQKMLELELRQAKQAAEQSASAKDIFLANMSHEIRTPMNAVFGMTRLLEKTNLLPQQRFYLKTIGKSAASLMVIVNDILDFSKISAGKLELERVGFKLEDVVATSVDIVTYQAEEKGLELNVQNADCVAGVLLGDHFRLKQIFMNLLTNAVKFTQKGSVTVTCQSHGLVNEKLHVSVAVKDTGRGMEASFLKILFEKFTQEDESIARSYSGTGLGMSISKHLIELMGGTIRVESQKNVGTTFHLDFYFDQGQEADLLIEEEVSMDILILKNKHILLVEDNETNQLVAQTVLQQNGLQVTAASNGLDALSHIKRIDFDLILMDMQMPVMDGLQATQIIRKNNQTIPIIALTANALEGERNKCMMAGMNDFLTKPFEENSLLFMLCKWLDKKPVVAQPDKLLIKPILPQPVPIHLLYNLEPLYAMSPGNADFASMLVKMFLDDAEANIPKIMNAFGCGDAKTLKSLIHRIRPSIEQLQIPYVAQLRRMEQLCLEENFSDELIILMKGFEELMKKVMPQLEAVLKELQ